MNPNVKIYELVYNSLTFLGLIASMILFITFTKGSYTYEYPKLIIYTYGFIFSKLLVKFIFTVALTVQRVFVKKAFKLTNF